MDELFKKIDNKHKKLLQELFTTNTKLKNCDSIHNNISKKINELKIELDNLINEKNILEEQILKSEKQINHFNKLSSNFNSNENSIQNCVNNLI